MIGTLIISAVAYTFGVVSGVGLREHNVLTMADLKASASRLIETAKSLAKPAEPTK